MNQEKDYYSVLGLPRSANADEIRRAYFEAARRYHPDKNLTPGETELFLDVQKAYEVLTNPKQRKKYDDTLPPEEIYSPPLDFRVIFSRQNLIRFNEPQLVYSICEFFQPDGAKSVPRPALNLCLVLDQSTSMQGRNMDVVKDTAIQIIRKIQPTDIFSVVAFSDRATTVIPAKRGTEPSKMEGKIRSLLPSGGTEIYSGLEAGYEEVIKNVEFSSVHHIILITDGHTYGDEEKCIELAHKAAEHGIGISGLGIGSEWNDRFLDTLARATGGSSIYLAQAADIQNALLDKFISLGKTYAEETRWDFTMAEGVTLRYAFRMEPELGELSSTSPIFMGPVIQGNRIKILLEFVVQPQSVDRGEVTLLDGKITLSLPNAPLPPRPILIKLTRPVSEGAGSEQPPLELIKALSRLKLYRMQEWAKSEAAAGNLDQASNHLQHLAVHLLAQGERDLAHTALLEAEHIQKEKSFSQQGGKELKYGTRALVLPMRSHGEQ